MVSKCFEFGLIPLTADYNITNWLVAMMIFYYSSIPEIIELFRTIHSLKNVYKGRLHGYVLGFIHLFQWD